MQFDRLFIAVVLGGIFFVAGQYVASQPQRVEQEIAAEREITVQGTGKVQAIPDVATITLGVTTVVLSTSEAATEELTEKFQAVVEAVERFDIAEEDIATTNLSVSPQYDFTEGRQTLRGYQASESVRLKIRERNRVGDIVAAVTVEGVNQVGGIAFDIDDPDDLQEQAQELAIEDARANAEELADALDVRLGRVKTFSATVAGQPDQPIFARATLEAVGGDAGGPPVPEGSQDVTATVTITYELR